MFAKLGVPNRVALAPVAHHLITLYEVLDDPDLLVEIADWESAEAHEAVMREPATAEALAPALELLASSFRAAILQEP